jgi:hypothetical protein
MNFLSQNEVLGQLVVQETFLYYDGPRLFMAENAAGQKFLINCLLSEDDSDTWLASAVSEKRLFALKDGNLELRDAFMKPELGQLIEFTTDKTGSLLQHSIKSPEQLNDDDLPASGVFLQAEANIRAEVSAAFSARSLNSNIVLLHLYPKKLRNEAPAKAVGHILTSFQDYVSIKLDKALATAHAMQKTIENAFQVNIVGTFAGSFGVEIAIRGEDPRISAALKEAVEELSMADQIDVFRDRMESVDDAEVSAMSRFMNDVAKANTDLLIEAASQLDSESVAATVPLFRLREAVKTLRRAPKLRTETKTLVVDLIGLNLRTKRFELREIKTDESIVGGMVAPIFSELQKAELPSHYRVVLEGIVRRTAGGTEKAGSWKMISATKLA